MDADLDIDLNSVVERNDDIVFTDLDDAIVMMDADMGRYYEFDKTAARIWSLIETRPTVAELCAALGAEYDDIDPDTCRTDVLGFLAEARELGLIRASPRQDGADR